jgi:hypothetical protein
MLILSRSLSVHYKNNALFLCITLDTIGAKGVHLLPL